MINLSNKLHTVFKFTTTGLLISILLISLLVFSALHKCSPLSNLCCVVRTNVAALGSDCWREKKHKTRERGKMSSKSIALLKTRRWLLSLLHTYQNCQRYWILWYHCNYKWCTHTLLKKSKEQSSYCVGLVYQNHRHWNEPMYPLDALASRKLNNTNYEKGTSWQYGCCQSWLA